MANSIGQLPVYLAKSLGFFEQEGLDVRLEELNSTAKTLEALIGGSVDVSATNYPQVLQAAAVGRNVTCFFVLFTSTDGVLAASPAGPVMRVEDLTGRAVGVTGLGSASQTQLSMILIRHGMKLTDVTPVAIGTAATAIAALENGRVDAAIMNSLTFETLRVRRPDVKALVDFRTPEGTATVFNAPRVPSHAAVASPRWMAENPDTARRVTRALARAARWIHEHSSAEIAANLPPSLQTPGSEAAVQSLGVIRSAFSRDGRMLPGGPEVIRDYLKLAVDPSLNVDLAKTYTNEYLEAAP